MSIIDYQNINIQNTKILDSYNDIRNQITMNEKNTIKPMELKKYFDNVILYLFITYYGLFVIFLYFLYFIKINNYLKIGIVLFILIYPFLMYILYIGLYPYVVYYFCLVLGIPYNPSNPTINKKVVVNYYNANS
jgi:nitrate reductase NapE component